MKIILWSLAGLLGLGVLAVGGFLWMVIQNQNRLGGAVKSLENEFSVGSVVQGLPMRALNLEAGSFDLYVIDESDREKETVVASADRTFGSLQPGDKFEDLFEKFQTKFAETATGRLIVAFPVFMNARWVLRVQFENGRVRSTESVYLD